MSTEYYKFRAPITSVRVQPADSLNSDLFVYIKGQQAGSLRLKNEEVQTVAELLCESNAVAVTVNRGGSNVGTIISRPEAVSGDTYLFSEYGEHISLRELLEKYPRCEEG